MSKTIKTLLLLGVPSNGKLEIKNYLADLPSAIAREELNVGLTIELSDLPYISFMRSLDEELMKLGQKRIYFDDDKNFADPLEWLQLIAMLNQDYRDLSEKPPLHPPSPARWLFWRLDMARNSVGGETRLNKIPHGVMDTLADRLEGKAKRILGEKKAQMVDNLDGKTVVIDFSRSVANETAMPLEAPLGYQHSLSLLSENILSNAAILHVSTVAEKTESEADFDSDDLEYLIAQSGKENFVKVEAHEKTFYLPVGKTVDIRGLNTVLNVLSI